MSEKWEKLRNNVTQDVGPDAHLTHYCRATILRWMAELEAEERAFNELAKESPLHRKLLPFTPEQEARIRELAKETLLECITVTKD